MLLKCARRSFSTTRQNKFNICILGSAGGIGQPLGLLLKLNPLVKQLTLSDVAKVAPGVAADLSHIETKTSVKNFPADKLSEAVKGANIVILAAGVPRKPGMSREDLFSVNATLVKKTAEQVAEAAPDAFFCIITNPINSVIPIACEIYKKKGKPVKNVFGITTLDTVRANTFVAEIQKCDPKDVSVPVMGGHAGVTIIPILSRATPCLKLPDDKMKELVKRIQEAGTEVVKAKAGGGSATLSMAYAAARFANSLMRGMKGESNVVECAYVFTDTCEVDYFSTPLVFGKNGIEKNLGIGKLSSSECENYKAAIEILKKNIEEGVKFAKRPC